MSTATTAVELSRLVSRLSQERAVHARALAEIDAAFAQLGITPKPVSRRGRKPGTKVGATPAAGAKRKGRRGRRTKAADGMTGEQFILSVLAKDKLQTAEINDKWKASGRNGRADILLSAMVKAGKIQKRKVKDLRGSQYSAA